MRRAMLLALVALGPASWGACQEVEEGRDIVSSIAIVYGLVTDEAGIGVAGATVSAYVLCDQLIDDTVPYSGTGGTDESGRYRVTILWGHVASFDACISVRAVPPVGTNLEETVVSGVEVTLRSQALIPPIDSVQVDLALPASG